MTLLAGIDIGGTKCAVCLGRLSDDGTTPPIVGRVQFPTPSSPRRALHELAAGLAALLEQVPGGVPRAVGVSCGGPLDGARGVALSPPNLPGWDQVDVLAPFRDRWQIPAALYNDANACALAEWHWGAGRGCRSMVFLTFGTGMGAGLILDGRLHHGATDMAGEVGHIRLADDGPLGYGKQGSFEGFCSGGGIARLAQACALVAIQAGRPPAFCPTLARLESVTAEDVGRAALAGDSLALEIFEIVGRSLGRGLAILIDILNPERIVLGGIFGRQQALLEPVALAVLRAEAHPRALQDCRVVPAGLGERVGDYAGLAAALVALEG